MGVVRGTVAIEDLHELQGSDEDSDQEPIPHPPIPDGSSELLVVEAIGEAQIHLARLIEAFELLFGKLHIQAGEIVLELGNPPCSDNRDYRHRTISEPSESDLRHAAAELFRNQF